MKRLLYTLLISISVSALFAAEAGYFERMIIGKWKSKTDAIVFLFNIDGTGSVEYSSRSSNRFTFRYRIRGKIIYFSNTGELGPSFKWQEILRINKKTVLLRRYAEDGNWIRWKLFRVKQ